MSSRTVVVALAACALFVSPATTLAAKPGNSGGKPGGGVTCNLPESNAEALEILSNYYPGYWWDHTNLTIAVQAHPSTTDEQLAAIRDAIATWSSTRRECFDGLITLTDVTGSKRQAADIIVHYVPTAGGVVFAGYAICGAHRCPNILVRSDLPPSQDRDPYDPEYLGWVTLHKMGTHSVWVTRRTCSRARISWGTDGRISAIRCCLTATSTPSPTSSPGR